jgi:hydroxymethylpyrimidine/phosphomethylpyrimidine kinase
MACVLDDIGADCIKVGMLHRTQVIETVCRVLAEKAADIPVVVDPVMMAKGGEPLLSADAIASLRTALLPRASVLTPNLPEAWALVGEKDIAPEDLAARLLDLGPQAVLVKGGHGCGPVVVDVFLERGGKAEVMESPRLETVHTHGTGCTLASAVATGLAQGLAAGRAVRRARAYVFEAIRSAPGFGHGFGPLNHGHTVAPFDGDG